MVAEFHPFVKKLCIRFSVMSSLISVYLLFCCFLFGFEGAQEFGLDCASSWSSMSSISKKVDAAC